MRIRFASFLLVMAMSVSALASYRISVWQPRTDIARERVRQHAGIITETNPVFYTMTGSQGAIYESSKATTDLWTSALAGTEIIPTFQNEVDYDHWGGTETANYVIHPNYRDAYTNQIVSYVVNRGWAGADIDYEGVPSTSKADFSAFISMLATKLHNNNKKLSVCVYAKTTDDGTWDGPKGQDWAAIGAAADYVKIMIYGPHSSQKPNSTYSYIGQVITYAKSKISDHKKIIVGMPWYAQEYWQVGTTWEYDSYGYDQAQSLRQTYGATPTRDTTSGEMTFSYITGGVTHYVWYTDGPAWAAKVQYVMQNHPTVGGFAQWSIGEEDPKVWGSVLQLKPRWEFNKDGNHDVVLRSASGDVRLYNLNGTSVVNDTIAGSDAAFTPVVAGHFTRDGQTDIVLRNFSTGEMKLWQMNNHTIAATSTMPTTTDTAWKVVGAADLDSDGRQEIIWQHPTTYGVAYWKRDLSTGTWSGYMFTPTMDPTWQLTGAADFNLDGTDDLVWHKPSTSESRIWFTNGGSVTVASTTTASGGWTLAGIGDFNRDAYPDFLWRHEATQATVIWFMKGSTLVSSGTTASADPVWKVSRVGDFDGDNDADVLWRHSTTGDLVLWTMEALAASSGAVAQPGSSYTFTAK